MHLEDDQLAEYSERGYLFFPGLLSTDEVAPLQAAVPELTVDRSLALLERHRSSRSPSP